MSRSGVFLFPSFHSDRQSVLTRGKRTGGELRERARRIFGAVEVKQNLSVWPGRIGVEISPGSVSFSPGGQVGKDYEKAVGSLFENRIELKRLSIDLERKGTGRDHVIGDVENVRDRNRLLGVVLIKLRVDSQFWIDGE